MLRHEPHHLEDELCFAIYIAQKNYNKFYSEALKEFKLTYSQYITLLVMWEEHRPMMIKELGERLQLDTGTLTPLLKRLQYSGWITRTRSGIDGRRVYLELTDKAKKEEKKVKKAVEDSFGSIDMDPSEYQESVATLKDISKKLSRLNQQLIENDESHLRYADRIRKSKELEAEN